MVFLTGDTQGKWVREIRSLGWGRMLVQRVFPVEPEEPWAFDCGAFSAWVNGEAWDAAGYWKRLKEAVALPTRPLFAVIPDRPAHPESLSFSLAWWERVANYPFPWFLAVQDGMRPEEVRELLPLFAGLFLGGSTEFKRTCRVWCDLAHAQGKRFHYARASSPKTLRLAWEIGADSADSVQAIRSAGEFAKYRAEWHRLNQGRVQTTMEAVWA